MQKKTRKTLKGGAKLREENKARIRKSVTKQEQIVHCMSQLKRFADCFAKGDSSRMLQFGYNLGRLQELCGETTYPEVWWKPIEQAIEGKKWSDLDAYLEELRDALGMDYDKATLEKGC
jgi:hypothetical protein